MEMVVYRVCRRKSAGPRLHYPQPSGVQPYTGVQL